MTPQNKTLKWLKFLVDFFDDEKIKLIEALPERDAIITIWFKLLAVAGKSDSGGLLLLEKRVPFTDEMLSTIFGRPLNTVRLALKTFESFGMIVMTEERIIQVEDWGKFQSLDADGKYREAARKRMAEHRAKKTLSHKVTQQVTQPLRDVTPIEGEEERDIEEEREKSDYVEIAENAIIDSLSNQPLELPDLSELWGLYCPSLPQIREISEQRKKKIRVRLTEHPDRNWWIDAMKIIEESDFCKGSNRDGWRATFDWLIQNQENAIKVLEGKYSNNPKKQTFSSMDEKIHKSGESYDYSPTDLEDFERRSEKKLRQMNSTPKTFAEIRMERTADAGKKALDEIFGTKINTEKMNI